MNIWNVNHGVHDNDAATFCIHDIDNVQFLWYEIQWLLEQKWNKIVKLEQSLESWNISLPTGVKS